MQTARGYYNVAVEGKIGVFKDITEPFHLLKRKNHQQHANDFVKEIFKMRPRLLAKNEIQRARYGSNWTCKSSLTTNKTSKVGLIKILLTTESQIILILYVPYIDILKNNRVLTWKNVTIIVFLFYFLRTLIMLMQRKTTQAPWESVGCWVPYAPKENRVDPFFFHKNECSLGTIESKDSKAKQVVRTYPHSKIDVRAWT